MSAPKGKPENSVTESLAQIGANLAARPYARRGVPMSNETIRVLLADDHAMVREGLRLLLRTAPDITVVGEAESGLAALALAERLSPHIVILGLDMPGGDGMGALKELGKTLPL
jgi:PleD family two-component response regulator